MRRLALVGVVIATILTGCREGSTDTYAQPEPPLDIPESNTKVYDIYNGEVEVWVDPVSGTTCFIFQTYEAGGIDCIESVAP